MPNDMLTGARHPARNAAELDRALRERAHDPIKLGQLLVRDHVITVDTLRRALDLQHRAPARKLGEILSEMGALTAAQAEDAVTAALEMPTVQLADFNFDPLAVALVPADMARQHHLIPLMFNKHMLVLAIHDPPGRQAREFLTARDSVKVALVFKGREASHADLAKEKLLYFMNELKEIGQVEEQPKKQGNSMFMVLVPLKS